MKNLFKKIRVSQSLALSAICVLCASVSPKAEAQFSTYSTGQTLTNVVFAIGGTVIAPTNYSFFVGDRRNVSLDLTISSDGAFTNQFALAFADRPMAPSASMAGWDTNASALVIVSNVQSAAGTYTRLLNVDTLGHGYMTLWSVNIGRATTTNSLTRSIKLNAP